MLPKEAEVVIIGGGVVGSSIAYFLSKAGKDVVVLDRGKLVGEASGANGQYASTVDNRSVVMCIKGVMTFSIVTNYEAARKIYCTAILVHLTICMTRCTCL